MNLKVLRTLSFLLLIFCLSPQFAFAAGSLGITVADPNPYSTNKSWFYFQADKDKELTGKVLVKNFGRSEVVANVYPVDAMVNEAGSFVLKFFKEEQKGLGKWMKINTLTVKLGPGEYKEIPFTINVPEDVTPGEYFGGIVAQESSSDASENSEVQVNSIGATVQTRVGSRVYLTVPGDVVEDFKWKQFEHATDELGDRRYFKFTFENNGNVSFEPSVTLRYYNIFGREIFTSSHDLGVSLPGSIIEPMVLWQDVPWFGKYTVKAELKYTRADNGQADQLKEAVLNKQVTVWVIPWKELIGFGVLVVMFFSYWLFRSLHFDRIKENADAYVVQQGDNVQDLAKASGVSWRLLVKLNNLKPPFVLEKGQEILIPKKKN